MELRIDPEFRDKIPPLTKEEFEQLRENILADGEVYEPIAVWNGTVIDGHNRWKIIQEHPEIPYRTKEMDFPDKWAAFDWMYKKQLGRRNLTDEQRTYLIGKMYEARKKTRGNNAERGVDGKFLSGQNVASGEPKKTRDIIAEEMGVGYKTVERGELFARGVDALREESPEAAETILMGDSGLKKKTVMEIPDMEPEQRKRLATAIEKGPDETKRVVQEFKTPVKMEEMNATPLNPEPYNEDDFEDQVKTFPEQAESIIRVFLWTHKDMLNESERCKKAFSEMLDGIVKMTEKYRKEYLA